MKKYNLGIDVGITSIGFAGVAISEKDIICTGVHIFEAAENPKDGSSLATPRREKRGLRRVIHRRAVRKRQLRQIFSTHGLSAGVQAIDAPSSFSPWEFRKDALHNKLDDVEFVRTLYHIGAHRGFQSNRKGAEPNDTDGKKALAGAKELEVRMMNANARTIGSYAPVRK